MREIKFRVWDFLNKRIIPWEELQTDSLFTLNEGDVPAMQYTGLKDKNGREIYEGDVVRGRRVDYYAPIDQESQAVVEYFGAAFLPFANDQDEAPYADPAECEVIGNIYENPELLK